MSYLRYFVIAIACASATSVQAQPAFGYGLQVPQLASAPQANDLFGFAVEASAFEPARVVVGAPGGFAEVYLADQGSSQGRVSFETRFAGVGNDNFGISVTIAGISEPMVAVGANGDDVLAFNAGRVHTYVFQSGTWAPLATITSPNPSETGNFGTAVSAFGNRLAVGEPRYRRPSDNQEVGAVHIYQRVAAPQHWALEQTFEGVQIGARFGQALRLKGPGMLGFEQLVVGAPLEDDTAQSLVNNGAAYVFVRSPTWAQNARVVANDRQSEDRFGLSVDIVENTLVVGAANDDKTVGADAGSVYVLNRGLLGIFLEQFKLRSSQPQINERFGQSLSLTATEIAIGAYCVPPSCTGTGAVYLFDRQGVLQQRLARSGTNSESLGHAVSHGVNGFIAAGAFSNAQAATGAGALYLLATTRIFYSGFESP